MEMNLIMQNEMVTLDIKKGHDFKKSIFKDTADYEKAIFDSELIDYKVMEKS